VRVRPTTVFQVLTIASGPPGARLAIAISSFARTDAQETPSTLSVAA